ATLFRGGEACDAFQCEGLPTARRSEEHRDARLDAQVYLKMEGGRFRPGGKTLGDPCYHHRRASPSFQRLATYTEAKSIAEMASTNIMAVVCLPASTAS